MSMGEAHSMLIQEDRMKERGCTVEGCLGESMAIKKDVQLLGIGHSRTVFFLLSHPSLLNWMHQNAAQTGWHRKGDGAQPDSGTPTWRRIYFPSPSWFCVYPSSLILSLCSLHCGKMAMAFPGSVPPPQGPQLTGNCAEPHWTLWLQEKSAILISSLKWWYFVHHGFSLH